MAELRLYIKGPIARNHTNCIPASFFLQQAHLAILGRINILPCVSADEPRDDFAAVGHAVYSKIDAEHSSGRSGSPQKTPLELLAT